MSTYKTLFRQLHNELSIICAKSGKHQAEQTLKKQTALWQYKKLNLIKLGMSIKEVEEKLLQSKMDSKIIVPAHPEADTHALLGRTPEQEATEYRDLQHIANITTFLQSQRVYQELLERYNPGMNMEQSDKVRKTAHRVGLELPELK
ncbi:hypothetical protein BABINDRAFT_159923 [Babjeviella inositovora NRRL Y-12698]|uniref:ATP synthase assembly factor FMC1, mitochondrial n=1 Tax=Babjeviella inositovora NRRL Y-12698 TaxID=984486 RepID=A0A1E3QVH2_9ASCO|nr:uncharacterized protein BABINDRAFT_159923 [Babjeviella inositovora NRRL Y-12698]ODQ81661.1 hypothetical protein BABINDRAFT_159923 [Babjeviella inositovora NRRL Y-12698]